MARCLTIDDFSVEERTGRCIVKLVGWDSDAAEEFTCILAASFPDCGFRALPASQGGFLGLQNSTQVVGKIPSQGVQEIAELLTLLTKSLTIEDNLDESHALGHHQDEDGATSKLVRSRLGSLVVKAKYDRSRAPRELLGNAVIEFIMKHPRYASGDRIASMPPHLTATSSSLPSRIVKQVSETLGLPRIYIQRTKDSLPQKDITDVDRVVAVKKRITNERNSMRVSEDLSGLSVIVIDDLYGSGGSMAEAARSLRSAGAREVLGLALTKQHLFEGVRLRK